MTQIKTRYCQDWCTEDHSPSDINENDSLIHTKQFETYTDGKVGMVDVWVEYNDSGIQSKGILVQTIEMNDSGDLKELA